MPQASSNDVQGDFAAHREAAEREDGDPVVVTHEDCPPLVILPVTECARPKGRDKRSLRTEELPRWMVDLVASAEMDPKFAHLDLAPGYEQLDRCAPVSPAGTRAGTGATVGTAAQRLRGEQRPHVRRPATGVGDRPRRQAEHGQHPGRERTDVLVRPVRHAAL